jgi:hypothetical protein
MLKTYALTAILLLSAAPAYACNPWAAGSTEEQRECLDSNMRNLEQEQAQKREAQALQDIADELRARNIMRAAGY